MSALYKYRRTGIGAMRKTHLTFVLFWAFTSFAASPVIGQCFELQALVGDDTNSFDHFGQSVSIWENTAIVGAPRDDCGVVSACGAAYIFRFDGTNWVQEQKLMASDGLLFDLFGSAVDISGDTAVVGAPGFDCGAIGNTDCGAVYVFKFNGTSWTEVRKLTASNASDGSELGSSVSVSGNIVVSGAPFTTRLAGANLGAAYSFRFNGATWVEQELLGSDTADGDFFGRSVSVDGNVAFVGADGNDCTGVSFSDCGAAYVFRFNGTNWSQEQKLVALNVAPEVATFDLFGSSVSLNGNVAVVGSRADDCGVFPNIIRNCGSASVYRFDGATWGLEQKLTASDAQDSGNFGSAVSVNADTIVVGAAPSVCIVGQDCGGAAYVFKFDDTTWVQNRKLPNPDAALPDSFGFSVSVSGATVIVGSLFGTDRVYRCFGCKYMDADGDGNIDILDFAVFQQCFTGPGE